MFSFAPLVKLPGKHNDIRCSVKLKNSFYSSSEVQIALCQINTARARVQQCLHTSPVLWKRLWLYPLSKCVIFP